MSTAFPVSDTARYAIATATAGQSAFAIPFAFLGDDDIVVQKTMTGGVTTTLTRALHYLLAGAGSPAGGTLTLKPAFLAKAGEIYTIYGQAQLSRIQSIVRGGKYSSAATDQDFDRLTLIAQELRRDSERSLRVKLGATPPAVTIGAAGTLAKWDASGNLAEGPEAAAIEAIETALGVEAGRALVHGTGGSDPFEAGARRITDLADGTEDSDAVTKAQLDALIGDIDPEGLAARVEDLEKGWRTGDFKFAFDTANQDGWVKALGGTIGAAGSGASTRANADTEALFLHLHAKFSDAQLPIFTSDGGATTRTSAAADWTAGRRLTLPNMTDLFPRASGANPMGTVQADQIKAHAHTASFAGNELPPHSHTIPGGNDSPNGSKFDLNSGGTVGTPSTNAATAGTPSGTVTVNSFGGDETRPKAFVLTPYIKL